MLRWTSSLTRVKCSDIAKDMRVRVTQRIAERQVRDPTFRPKLAVVQVGDRVDSTTYVAMKRKHCARAGILLEHVQLESCTGYESVAEAITRLNSDPGVHGVLLQLPLPGHLDHRALIELIHPSKDIDGFTLHNMGRLSRVSPGASGAAPDLPEFTPCTPKGILALLTRVCGHLTGKKVVVLGRSDIVGSPMASLLARHDCTVSVCHSKTPEEHTIELCRGADIIVSAMGRPAHVRGTWVSPGTVVVDVGINQVPDTAAAKGYRLVGDVCYDEMPSSAYCTPVPGGVGRLTVASLLENTLEAAERWYDTPGSGPWTVTRVCPTSPTPSDLDIAQSVAPKPIASLASEIGLRASEYSVYGPAMAKVGLGALERLAGAPNGHYVCVAGVTPTPQGEGKTTTLLGLVQGLAHLGHKAVACVRQPSQGPTFGAKGGAAGGGYAQVLPMEDFNLHLTGDMHAVAAAHNLMAAAIDTRLVHEASQSTASLYKRLAPRGVLCPALQARAARLGLTPGRTLSEDDIRRLVRLDIVPESITWKRVVDVNDRGLRHVRVGGGRDTGFQATAASEIMAVLGLATGHDDLRARLDRMVFGTSGSGAALTAGDLGLTGALLVLLKDAMSPTLLQSLEGTPVLVHTGPFANIASGNSSVVADTLGLKLAGPAGFAVTEAGFGADIGYEKFLHLKCRASGLAPSLVVLTATVRALKVHGAGDLRAGCANMTRHLHWIRATGVGCVVAINRFASDTDQEVALVRQEALRAGALEAVESTHHAEGGRGAVPLARAVNKAVGETPEVALLYPDDLDDIEQKLTLVVQRVYGGRGVHLSDKAREQMLDIRQRGWATLPICMAKTPYSFTADPRLKNAPSDFILPIREIQASVGAGFLVALAGDVSTMPGLPTRPAFYDMDLHHGKVVGLS